ncbi:MAG: DUF4294 domain-containing protein [Bacteroidetes bacterium]|nr:DUF4294 domain-containing protein [Bacteroidota bacterium]MBL7104711.1 DUF4294 domain-containing protein [Bacteroidales bacterium]
MKKIILTILSFLFILSSSFSQKLHGIVVKASIVNNDTVITIELPEYCVNAKMPRKFKVLARKYGKLVKNVKKVYPYAKVAGIKLNKYEEILVNASSEKERKRLMKQAEKELRDEFEDDIKNFTFKQGIILIKLVDRETGNSSYILIQELRGKFIAFFWQTFARIFGYNLKIKYDPQGRDKDIENIVLMIENGQI